MNETLIAHSAPEGGKPQSLHGHLRNVADLAAEFAEPFDAEDIARWLGWWHDAGKVHPDIQAYLQGRGISKDHSSVGMLKGIHASILTPALCCAGHHGGLSNANRLSKRAKRKKQDARIQEALQLAEEFLKPLAKGNRDVVPALQGNDAENALQLEMWSRFVHAALVDADYIDTERHFDPQLAALRSVKEEPETLLQALINDQNQFGAPQTEVNRVRDEIYRSALKAGENEPGMFNMTVPTGGGKTRSVMAFALKQAAIHDLKRVIIALPFTSIIDQNAEVYQEIFGSDYVLEHHSAVGRASRVQYAKDEQEEREILSAQNWDVPIVITTTVQLLETLFSNQNSRLRKLHRYADSVIVLDEVQSIPPPFVEPTMWALRELTRRYRSSVVLCTATQPGYGPIGHYESTPIIPDPTPVYDRMQRVSYNNKTSSAWPVTRVAEEMRTASQSLVICNTKRDAQRIAEKTGAYYLSSGLCQAHRKTVLSTVKDKLKGEPVQLASTQVIEAGVDIDFPLVLRDVGPLDSIIQSGGRCNREGKLDQGRVVIFRLEDGSCPPPPYQTGRDIALRLLRKGVDLNDPNTSRIYFEELYNAFPTDEYGIQDLRNRFQYEQVAAEYQIIPDNTVSVLVHYEDSTDILKSYLPLIKEAGYVPANAYQALQPYTVNVYEHQFEEAQNGGVVTEVAPDLWLWHSDLYHADYGLQTI